jgi:hypothetical protein
MHLFCVFCNGCAGKLYTCPAYSASTPHKDRILYCSFGVKQARFLLILKYIAIIRHLAKKYNMHLFCVFL